MTTMITPAALPTPGLLAGQELDRLRTMGEIVAGLAHDIDTPLGIVSQAAQIIGEALASGNTDAESLDDIREAAALITNGIGRAVRLVKSFRNISHGQMTDSREVVNLADLTEQCVTLFRVKARGSQITVAVENQLELGDAIWNGFPGHLSQILLNLLSNAARYAYEPGAGGSIQITLAGNSEAFCVTVRDFGKGVSAENLAQLFDPWFTTGRDCGGTGLGMGIVRNLIETSLGGRVFVESSPGQGMKISFTMPRSI